MSPDRAPGDRVAPLDRVAAGDRVARAATGRVVRAVLATELAGLIRDRRALFSAIVLPVLLYPVLFAAQGWLENVSRHSLESRTIGVALDLSQAPSELALRVRGALGEELPIELVEVDATALRAQAAASAGAREAGPDEARAAKELLAGAGQVLLVARGEEGSTRTHVGIYFDGTSDLANEARSRVAHALDVVHSAGRAERLAALPGGDPARELDPEMVDVASERDRTGARLGRFLPLLAALVVLSGGSYAALSAFAGEREGKTLETLLVQPVPAWAIAWGKLGAVLATGCVTLVCNTASLLACGAFGLGTFGQAMGGELGAQAVAGPRVFDLAAGRLALGALVFLPAVVLLCALLCTVAGRARTFREGQLLVLPLTLVVLALTLASTQADVELGPVLGAVPLTGPALALRDVLRGDASFAAVAWTTLAQGAWAWLALRSVARTLDLERILQNEGDPRETALRRTQSRSALAWGWIGVLSIYLIQAAVQPWSAVLGLVLTLWVALPLLALSCARASAERAGTPVVAELRLRAPHAAHALGALLLAPGVAELVRRLVALQASFLPMPVRMLDQALQPPELAELSPAAALLLLALSPAIAEELFFRGAVLSGLARDLSPRRCALWQAVLFAAAHWSIYRWLPTGLLGALLGLLTLRARSLWPAVLLHAGVNAWQLFGHEAALPAWIPWLAVPGALLVLVRRP